MIFTGDTYDTPDNTRRYLSEYIFLGSRWSYYVTYIGEIFRSRSQARRGVYDDEAWSQASLRIVRNIEGCGGRFHVSGMDHFRRLAGPVIFVSNHMSTLETQALPCLINPVKPVTYVVKEELVKARMFGPIIRARNPIVVGRKNPREDLAAVLAQGMAHLARGRSLIIFPESTRSEVFHPGSFNTLGVKLARQAGVPVVPVAVKTDFWGNGKYLRSFGPIDRRQPIYIRFGEPLTVAGNGKAEHERIVRFISDNLRAWGGRIASKAQEK
jgi:1-acyl-sn-glycerol-3-phosphate acyltransferase